MRFKLFSVLVFLSLSSVLANAAIIQGTVYDLGLEEVTDALVTINTTPAQKIVAKDATYRFEVLQGEYALMAKSKDGFIEENISASGDGSFIVDLILLPDIGPLEDEILSGEMVEVPNVDPLIQDTPSSLISWLGWLLLFGTLALVIVKFSRSADKVAGSVIKQVAVDDDLKKVLKIIDESGGRATQKEIRKGLPYSEAKISLMISELEDKGLVSRIKKGRSNIVVKK